MPNLDVNILQYPIKTCKTNHDYYKILQKKGINLNVFQNGILISSPDVQNLWVNDTELCDEHTKPIESPRGALKGCFQCRRVVLAAHQFLEDDVHTNAFISSKLSARWMDQEYNLFSYKMAGMWCCIQIATLQRKWLHLCCISCGGTYSSGNTVVIVFLSVSNFRAFLWLCWSSCARR